MTKVVLFVCFVLLKEGLCSLECKINGRERDEGRWGGWGLAGGCGNGRERDWKGTISKIWRLADYIRRREKSVDSKVSRIWRMETVKGIAWL